MFKATEALLGMGAPLQAGAGQAGSRPGVSSGACWSQVPQPQAPLKLPEVGPMGSSQSDVDLKLPEVGALIPTPHG